MDTPIKSKKLLNVLKIPPSPLMKKIGFGTGIAVYELERSPLSNISRSPWAVKKLITRSKKDKTSKLLNARLQTEAKVLRKLNHSNIVGFRAFIKDSKGSSALAMEECSSCLGDLIEHKFENGAEPFPPKTIIKVSYDIAKALNYLHNEVLLLHCDIKSYNILVKEDFEICKLCDFGVCLPLTRTGELDIEKAGPNCEYDGTTAWCAPEVLKYPPEITSMADIYALGLVMWEMIALALPIDDNLQDSASLVLNESLDSNKENEYIRQRPALPDIQLGPQYNLILEIYFCCTTVEKYKRPTASDMTVLLQEIENNC